jgi:hypothetical protein
VSRGETEPSLLHCTTKLMIPARDDQPRIRESKRRGEVDRVERVQPMPFRELPGVSSERRAKLNEVELRKAQLELFDYALRRPFREPTGATRPFNRCTRLHVERATADQRIRADPERLRLVAAFLAHQQLHERGGVQVDVQ